MSGGDLSAVFEVSGRRTSGWREIDAALRSVAKGRAALDAEEARWLVAARTAELHRHFGYATILEYMERVLGYGPGAAMERLRVAEALVELPAMARELADGKLAYSAVRELSRVVVPETETVWLAAARGRTVRDVEHMVSGRRPGDLPDAPRSPADTLGLRPLRFDVKPETQALVRQCVRVLEDERGERLDDDEVLAAMCRAILDGDSSAETRARHEIALTVCEQCDRGWQQAAGASIEVPPEVVERARCDAREVGRVDASTPARATTAISPATRRQVWRRDGGRCRVPGCRSTRHLDLHHLKHRADGGDHKADNLCLLCGGHHAAHHEGKLIIEGTIATGLVFKHADGRLYGAPTAAAVRDDVMSALRNAGFAPAAARAAVEAAISHVGAAADLATLLKHALQTLRPGAS